MSKYTCEAIEPERLYRKLEKMGGGWKRWLWFLPPLCAFAALGYLNRPDGFSIGTAPIPVEYVPRRVLTQKPWIQFTKPDGSRFEYPQSWSSYENLDKHGAGILSIGPPDDATEKWRVDGVEYPADFVGWGDYTGGESSNDILVPYALAPDKRHVELLVKGRWVPVTLPYEEGHRAPPLAAQTQTSNGFTMSLIPQPRTSPATDPTYKIELTGGSANLMIASADVDSKYSSRSFHADYAVHIGSEPLSGVTAEANSTNTLEVTLADAEVIPMVVDIQPIGRSAVITSPEGRVLYDYNRGIIPYYSGYDAIMIPAPQERMIPTWVGRTLFKRNFLTILKGLPIRLPALGYRFRREGHFKFVVENWRPDLK